MRAWPPATGLGRGGYALSGVDGSPIFYELDDRRTRRDRAAGADTAVLCDGIGCDGFVWKYLRGDLGPRYRLIHPHYRGHGRTPRPRDPERVAVPDLAADVASVLEDAGGGRAVLFGHSLGVQVCLETYRRTPEMVAGLVLLCGSPGHLLRTFRGSASLEPLLPRLRATVDRAPALFNRLARTLIPTQLAFTLAAKLEINAELLERPDFMPYLEGLSRVDVDLFMAMLSAAADHTTADLLPTGRAPCLVVAGDRDGFTPPERSRELAETIPGAELLMVEGGSHIAPIERPHLVGDTVLDFLERRIRA